MTSKKQAMEGAAEEYRRMLESGQWKEAAAKFRPMLGEAGFEALKAAASVPTPSGAMKCANCSEEFNMPAHAVAGRAKAGWCVGCWNQKDKCLREKGGREYWTTGRPGRTRFDARPRYDA